jgi:hypothetical protein
MLKQNSRHLGRVALYGGILTALVAVAGYFGVSGKFALSVLAGGALSLANIYSIILMVETIVGAALESGASGPSKGIATVMHLLKLGAILIILAALVITRIVDVIGLMAGFTGVLLAHGAAGFVKARENLLIEEAAAAEEAERAEGK